MITSNTFFPAEKKTWPIVFLALNIVVFAVVMYSALGDAQFLLTRLKAHWESLLIVYLGLISTLVAGNLITGRFKALLVFWDWSQTFPIARVFTRYLPKNNNMDSAAQDGCVSRLPRNPTEQEALWLRLYDRHKNNPAVRDIRNDFLLAQELTWLSFVVLVFFGVGSLIIGKSTLQTLAYPTFLLVQYVTASIAARSLGIRFSGDVLAVGELHKVR